MEAYISRSNVHSHTTFSDGKNTPREMIEAAIAMGFHTLGFSEHGYADYDPVSMPPAREALYREEVRRLKGEYAGRIHLLMGYEHEWLYRASDTSPYDFVIESAHYVEKDGEKFCVDDTREILLDAARRLYGLDMYALCRDYFRTVCDSIEQSDAQILGHIELVMKFNEKRDLFDDADPRYLTHALACAELAARSGKLVEINTGAIARGYRTQPYPGAAMLRRIHDCGGRIILTSDCHNAKDLACGFPASVELAKACGFETAWEYRGNTPVEYAL